MKYEDLEIKDLPGIIERVFNCKAWYFWGKIYLSPQLGGVAREKHLKHEYHHHLFRDTKVGYISDLFMSVLPLSLLFPPLFIIIFAGIFFFTELEEGYIFKKTNEGKGEFQNRLLRDTFLFFFLGVPLYFLSTQINLLVIR